jgi:hypothetical protein
MSSDVVLLPDAGPLITLAYADALDLLLKPRWSVTLVDMVLTEVTRNQTPTSEKLSKWVGSNKLPIRTTKTFQYYQRTMGTAARKSNLGELAIQEAMNEIALEQPPKIGVFLFEDHKIARVSFHVPDNCRKVSTRAFLIYLEEKGWLESATEVEQRALLAGRAFSSLRFPP